MIVYKYLEPTICLDKWLWFVLISTVLLTIVFLPIGKVLVRCSQSNKHYTVKVKDLSTETEEPLSNNYLTKDA